MADFVALPDLKDFYIRWKGHPKYDARKLFQDDILEMVVQKLEMLLFTNEGAVLGDEECGLSLEFYLWKTNISNHNFKMLIIEQINMYIPELNTIGYTLNLDFFEGAVQDTLVLNFVIKGYNINFILE